VNSVGYGLKA